MIKMEFSYKEVILSIMAATLLWGVIELCRIHDSIRYDYRPEKNIHFNRWYDVSMFKGTQLNIEETKSESPFVGFDIDTIDTIQDIELTLKKGDQM